MTTSLRLLPALLLAAATASCTAGEDSAADRSATDTTQLSMPDTATLLNLQGDFEGPLGLQLWSVREQLEGDLSGTLAWVREQGFTEVELAGTQGLSAEAFREELDRAGLRATAMHVPYERLQEDMEGAFAEAQALGATDIGVAWIPHEGPFTVELARQTAADFNLWGSTAVDYGLRFYYHNHGYEFRPDADGTIPFDVLMEETDPATVFYEMDVFWTVHPGVDPVELLRRYPDRWRLMHIKDMAEGIPTGDFSGGAPAEAQVVVGTGQIDMAAVLAAAEEVGVEKYYVEDETTDPIGNIPLTLQYLQTITY